MYWLKIIALDAKRHSFLESFIVIGFKSNIGRCYFSEMFNAFQDEFRKSHDKLQDVSYLLADTKVSVFTDYICQPMNSYSKGYVGENYVFLTQEGNFDVLSAFKARKVYMCTSVKLEDLLDLEAHKNMWQFLDDFLGLYLLVSSRHTFSSCESLSVAMVREYKFMYNEAIYDDCIPY